MYIKNIELKDFRNYESLNLKFNKKINLVLGQNAQGKTNLLEAISITSLGKSFRTLKDNELIKFGSEFCKVKIDAEKEDEDLVIEIVISKSGKAAKINGKKVKKTSELLKNIYIVIFSPEDLRIVKDEPEKRRKFIDRELCQLSTSYYVNLVGYKKTLSQRNSLLKEQYIDEKLLDIWDMELVKYGSSLIIKRNEFCDKLNIMSSKIHKDITNGKENLKVSYEPNVKVSSTLKEQKELFYKEIQNARQNDIKNRTTSKGPHRDDLKLEIENIDLRNFGSQGQQRTAALSLKLAEINLIKEETGEYPVLLLDDVMSELDKERQTYMIKAFENVQLFITTTELSDDVKMAFENATSIYVKNGTCKIK